MKKKSLIVFISILFLIANIPLANTYNIKANSIVKKTIYIDDDNINGPWFGTKKYPYQHIQDGIDNATNYDLIFVFNGTYNEHVIIDKTIIIQGENKNNTIIDGLYNDFVIHIIEKNVQLYNFTIRNSGGFLYNAGIKLDSNYNLISDCIIYRAKTGIFINEKNYNEIKGVIFHKNGDGVKLKFSQNNNISGCYFFHNGIGINVESSENLSIFDCYANTNGIAYFLNNSNNIKSIRCAAYDNNDNQGGFFISSCTNINICNNNIYHNGFGIKINNCSTIKISFSNFLYNTHTAIKTGSNSKDIIVTECEISENLRFGVFTQDSNIKLYNNNVYSSLCGLQSEHSIIDASYNWWGSSFGPAIFERESKDRIFKKSSRIMVFPWLTDKSQTAGSDWDIDYEMFKIEFNSSRYVDIDLFGQDSDNDLAPDWWEDKWNYDPFHWDDHKNIDSDKDGLNNIEECYTDSWGSNPFHKDIFLEIDYVEALDPNNAPNRPPDDYLEDMVEVFEKNNISLHIDTGNLNGGEEIPFIINFSYSDLLDIYWDYFLHNDLNNPRKGIFHYCLICDVGAGPGFAFVGWDSLDSFQISAQQIQNDHPLFSRGRMIIGGSIHELGHTLGLNVDDHGGNDNRIALKLFSLQWWKYRNYKSCMNYMYTYIILDFSDGMHGNGDFNDWANMDFSFFKNTHFIKPDN